MAGRQAAEPPLGGGGSGLASWRLLCTLHAGRVASPKIKPNMVMAGEGAPDLWSWGRPQVTVPGNGWLTEPPQNRAHGLCICAHLPHACYEDRGQARPLWMLQRPGLEKSCSQGVILRHLPWWGFLESRAWSQDTGVAYLTERQGEGRDSPKNGLLGRSPLGATWVLLPRAQSENQAAVPQKEPSRARRRRPSFCATTALDRRSPWAGTGRPALPGRKASGMPGEPGGQSLQSTVRDSEVGPWPRYKDRPCQGH